MNPARTPFLTPEIRLATFCKALGHPARVAIVKALARDGQATCGDLVDLLPLAQSTVSQHLKALREASLVRGEADGPRTHYRLEAESVAAFRGALGFLLARLDAASPPETAPPDAA